MGRSSGAVFPTRRTAAVTSSAKVYTPTAGHIPYYRSATSYYLKRVEKRKITAVLYKIMIKTNTAAFGMTLFSGVVVLSIARSRRQSSISLPGSSPSAYGTLHLGNGNANDGKIVGLLPWRSAISKMPEDETSGSSCELKIVNNFDEPVLLCWVDEKGAIRSHRRVNDTSISDGSVSNEHLEYTFVGHSFVCIRECDPLPKSMKEVTLESFLFVYTLALGRARHLITLSSYTPRFFSHRHHKVIVNLQCVPMQSDEDEKLIDTSSKVYNTREICGFTVHTEEGLDACLPELLATIQKDLEVVVKLLPPIACEKLQQSTPFWVNKTHTYGKVSSPVEGRHMCYHPIGGTVWLQKNGMALNKEGCIEMYCAADYLEDRHLW